MDNNKNDKYYAGKIIENIETIQRYIGGVSYEQFIKDDELMDAVMFRFIQLIENINKISKDFKEKNDHIPWGKNHRV